MPPRVGPAPQFGIHCHNTVQVFEFNVQPVSSPPFVAPQHSCIKLLWVEIADFY